MFSASRKAAELTNKKARIQAQRSVGISAHGVGSNVYTNGYQQFNTPIEDVLMNDADNDATTKPKGVWASRGIG